ncbi:MAG: carbamoyltransferase [Deltaproteobacteria bacterium]|nr:carbamoyltransferase [Deltaproteobacteria bacterium]
MAVPDPLVLAIHEDTNANAALVRGTEIVAAVAEERISRRKYQAGFPTLAVAEVLRLGGVRLGEVGAIAAGNRYHFVPRLLGSAAIEGEHDLFGLLHNAWSVFQSGLRTEGAAARAVEAVSSVMLRHRFGRPVTLHDHHTAHAYSAYYTSGTDTALAVSVDNLGDGWSARAFRCAGGRVEPLWGSDATGSPGQFYGEISQFLGFHVLDAGKVTGLAARGDPAAAYPVMERLFSLDPKGPGFRLAPVRSKLWRRGPFRDLARFSPAEIAAAAQRRLEDVIVAWVRRGLAETGARDLVLAGGVFANVRVNQRLWGLPEVDSIFVHPAMSDQGIAVGAALAHVTTAGPRPPRRIRDVFLGASYSESEIGDALEDDGLRYERPKDLEAAVADLVAARKVVARFDGRMEYGPRALGNRSILASTEDAGVNDRLNARLGRSEFMPFAPSTLAEHAANCYLDYGPGADLTSRFMTITFDCSDWMKAASPAVVHLDGTARPQVVHEADSPSYHRILRLVFERTGVPSVVNTSFNLHGEPIVCSPRDAIRSFGAARLDALAIGPFLVRGN